MEIDVGINVLVAGVPYALFDDGEMWRIPASIFEDLDLDFEDEWLVFQNFDEVVEFMTLSK